MRASCTWRRRPRSVTSTDWGSINGRLTDFDPFDLVYRRFEGMIGRLEPMRRRLVQVPLRLDHPYWIDDPDFDLDYHVRHIGLAPPGAADQLAEQVARIVARPMDRSHPLWECYVIEGLADGRWAMLTKTHHSTIDGASGVILLNMLTDTDPEASNTLDPVPWTGEPIPSDREMLQLTASNLALNPLKGLRLQLRLVRDIASAAGLTSISGLASQARSTITSIATGGESDNSTPRSELPVDARTPDAVVQVDHLAPSVRDAFDVARQHQGAQGRHRMHGQRHRDGDLCGSAAAST